MLNAAICGLGRWGRTLVDSVQGRSETIRFVAACAGSPDRHRGYCAGKDLRLLDDYEALLADPDIDAIVLATPHSVHAEQVVAAAATGRPVFAEKPFALHGTDAARAVAACERAGVVLACGFNRRFQPNFVALDDAVRNGELGDILHIEGQFSGPTGLTLPPDYWRATRAENPGGAMGPRGIHFLDAMIGLAGAEVKQLFCHSDHRVIAAEMDDTTSMLLRFANGLTGYLSTIFATGEYARLQVIGTKGWLELRGRDRLEGCDVDGNRSEKILEPGDTVRAALEGFAAAVAGSAPYPVTHDQLIASVAAHEAIGLVAGTAGGPIDVASPADLRAAVAG
jgi:predicted dehydrogenase